MTTEPPPAAPLAPHPLEVRRRAFITYLASLGTAKIVLYCYLIWWLFAVGRYFDASPRLWLSSLGLSAVIGTALYLSTAHAGSRKTELDRSQIFRLYLMPFCVSSFAALIKDRGFVLVFHPTLAANLAGLAYCAAFVALVALAKLDRAKQTKHGQRPHDASA